MKHIYFLITAFLLITSNIMAQDVKTATYKNGNVFKSFQYYLNDFNDTIYHGKYVDSIYKVVSNKYPTVFYNTGTYADGKRIGQWEFSFRRLKNEDHLEGYLTKTVQFNNEGRLDGLYEVIESEQYMTKESGRAFKPIFYPFARYSILRDYYSKKYDYHLKINYRDGIQQDFYSEATWYPYEVENGKIKPYAPYITNLSGKFDKNGVATGVWVECYGSEKSTWEAEDSLAVLSKYAHSVIGDIFVYYLNGSKIGRISATKFKGEIHSPSDVIDVYYSLDKVQEHYGPGLELFAYELTEEDNLRDSLFTLLFKTEDAEGREAKVERLLDDVKKYNSPLIDRCDQKKRFALDYSCNSTMTLYNELYKMWKVRARVLKIGKINLEQDYSVYKDISDYQQDIKLLSKYLQVKQDEIKIDTIAQKYNCQNYIDYNTFKSKCNQRWEIIESQTSDNGYYGQLEKLHSFVKNTLSKCEKIEMYNETNNKIVSGKSPVEAISIYSLAYNELYNKLCNETNAEKQAEYEKEIEALQKNTQEKCEKLNSYNKTHNKIVVNKAKKAIVTKYSIAYKELFHNLCNETNVEKQVQFEKEIEDLQSKTQEICSVTDTKAFEKQLKSASGGEQIKTMIFNYK